MVSLSRRSLCLLLLPLLIGLAIIRPAQGAVIFPKGSAWNYFKGTAEASAPDTTVWRLAGFDDATWLTGNGAFFYENGSGYSGGTDLTDMFGQYSTVFLRKTFVVDDPATVTSLTVDLESDDGCIVWINGTEVDRVNAPAGDIPFNGTSLPALGEPNTSVTTIADPGTILVAGTNVVAVQAINASSGGSSDFLFDLALTSTEPDPFPPEIASFSPAAGTVNQLSQVQITFSEPVTGVTASALLVNGQPAATVVGSGDTYTFSFPQPPYGLISIGFNPSNTIVDSGVPPNPFDATDPGATWQYQLLDNTPPTVASVDPPAGNTVNALTQIEVRFSENVTGVDAGDLLVDGVPAAGLTAVSGSTYRFQFAQPAQGTVNISWALGHGIQDAAAVPNGFEGGGWSYELNPAAQAVLIISEFMAANVDTLKDEDGESSDWIEVHNDGALPVDLDGWFLTDTTNILTKWRFPSTNLNAGAYLVVFASGKDRRVPGRPLHTNFKLSAGGEYLALVQPDGTNVVSEFAPVFPPQITGVSYGLVREAGPSEALLNPGAPVKALVPADDALGLNWTAVEFDDSGWTNGTSAVGYDRIPFGVNYLPLIGLNVESMMYPNAGSLYVRIPFTVPNLDDYSGLTLHVQFDDGFIAYLNGQEIARSNAPVDASFNSIATTPRTDTAATNYVAFDVSFARGFLNAGANILAFQALNNPTNSPDLLLLPTLEGQTSFGPLVERFFPDPTPGAANNPGLQSLGPIISDVQHSPTEPGDADDLIVTARLRPSFASVASAALHYRVMFGAEFSLPFLDDGAHGDGPAGDGVYGAILPAGLSAPGQMLRWYVTATDGTGTNTSRFPPHPRVGSPEYLGTVIADPVLTNPLPVFQWFVQNVAATDTDAGTRCSVYWKGEFYDNVFCRVRGATAVRYSKKPYKFDFNPGDRFRMIPGQPRMDELNLNSTYHDKAYVRAPLSMETYRLTGAPACDEFNVRVQQNNAFYSVAVFVEQVDETFLVRRGFNPSGPLYKMYNGLTSSTTGVEKKIRRNENNADLQELVSGLSPANPNRGPFVFDHFDMPALINYLAAGVLIQDMDRTFKNYYLYRDPEGTGLWHIFPWDKDLTFGLFGLESDCLSGSDDSLPYDGCHGGRISHPLFGSQGRTYPNGVNNMFDAVYNIPATREMFLRRLRTLMDQFLQPPGTPPSQRFYEQRLDALIALLRPDAALDFGRWHAGFGLPDGLDTAMTRLKMEYLDDRRMHLYQTHGIDNIGNYPDVAGIPHAQTGSPALNFGAIEVNPASGNQAEEYVELINPTPVAVDISGWRIEGGIDFNFAPGTVVPSLGSVYLSPDLVAFRNRATSPRGGESRLVVGNYRGQLSARGETLRLIDGAGRIVRTNAYPENPSPAQRFLRITEIMYHPAPFPDSTNDPEDFEFLELKNVSTNITLNLAGVRLADGVSFDFSQGTVTLLPPQARLVVVRNLQAFATRFNTDAVAGQYTGALDNAGERLRLLDASGEEILDFTYNDNWYPITDGQGFSLVVVDENAEPDLWDHQEQWRPGGSLHGTPGSGDPAAPPIPPVLITEVLSRSDVPPPTDSVELYNPTDEPVNVGGWFITDDFAEPKKYRISNNTIIPAGGYLVRDESDFNPLGLGFAFSSLGDEVYLFSGDAQTNLTGYVDGFKFGAAADGVSFERHLNSVGQEEFVAQETLTLGATNSGPRVGPLVISEIMYHPNVKPGDWVDDPLQILLGPGNPASVVFDVEDSLEYVEVMNESATPLPLYDPAFPTNRWRLSGAVAYEFPINQILQPGGLALVVDFDPAMDAEALNRFRSYYNLDPSVVILGPWSGKLSNTGERIQLERPDTPNLGVVPRILVDAVAYQDNAPWPTAADGTGSSLQRLMLNGYGNEPTNWFAAGRSPGQTNIFNLAPNVTLVSPTNGTVVGQGETILLSAEADDPDGQIISVQFYSGGTFLGEVTSRPFDFAWTNAEFGLHSLTARATDDRFAVAVSDPVLVTLEAHAPTVTITSPSDGAKLLGSSIPIVISAYDEDGFVALAEFFSDNTKLGEVDTAPFTFNWTNLTFGAHTLWVAVTDNSGNRSFSPTIAVTVAGGFLTNRTVIAAGSYWKYFDQGVDLGTNWSQPDFDDSNWPAGPAQLGYGDGDEATVVGYGSDPNNKYVTTYFRKTFNLSGAADTTQLHLEILRDDGAAVYLNGAEVFRTGLPEGPLTFNTFANITVVNEDENTFYTATLDPAWLVEGDNTIAVEIHQRSGDSSDISFDLKLEATQKILAPTIVSHPVSQSARAGSNVVFSVAASGTEPLHYQWQFNGVDLPGKNGSELVLNNVQLAQSGGYTVVVTNPAGSALSVTAYLIVTTGDYAGAVLSDHPVHYYRFEELSTAQPAADEGVPGGAPGTYRGGITVSLPSATAVLGSAMQLDGASGTLVDLGRFHLGDAVSVEAWVRVDPNARVPWNAVVARWDGSYEIAIHSDLGVSFAVRNQVNSIGQAWSPSPPARGQWHHLVGIFSGGTVRVFLDGVKGDDVALSGLLQDAGPSPDRVMIGSTRDGTGSSAFNLKGAIDEVALYDYALPPERILAHYATAFAPPPAPPELTINAAGDIAWPTLPNGYVLQFTDSLNVPVFWQNYPATPVEENGFFKVTVSLTDTNRFYRLAKP
jgi:CotH kinase protein/Concanavalin A-like lectin/glucanases superfamily/Bacterial Ig domain/Lamin Tail Domain/Immunoglobulin domain